MKNNIINLFKKDPVQPEQEPEQETEQYHNEVLSLVECMEIQMETQIDLMTACAEMLLSQQKMLCSGLTAGVEKLTADSLEA